MRKENLYRIVLLCLISVFVFSCGDDDDDDDDGDEVSDDDAVDDDDTEDDDDDSTEGWATVQVDPSIDQFNHPPTIVTDSGNQAHIVYVGGDFETAYHLWHWESGSGKGDPERIDQMVNSVSQGLAIDDEDHLHVSYHSALSEKLSYATNQSGDWEIEEVNEDFPAWGTDLAVDPDGSVYIVYYLKIDKILNAILVTNASGDWVSESLWDQEIEVPGLGAGFTPRIETDADGNLHVIINPNRTPEGDIYLLYLTNASGEWEEEEIFDDDTGATWPTMKVEPAGTAHVAIPHREGGIEFLKYVAGTLGSWADETVYVADSDELADQACDAHYALAIDSTGAPHIATRVLFEDFGIGYVTQSADGWNREFVDESNLGRYMDIAMDSSGKAHIAYQDSREGEEQIWYATNAGL